MPKHEQKYCPNCQKEFECKVGSITLCQCATVTLNSEEMAYIRNRFDDCLCAACMEKLKQEYNHKQYENKLKTILGVHYNK
ncbi:cysteine-rich CWC family protein [Neptunitalea chrysea]|uniref:cysteine-rich CWC family protein n=1 Tax=Neptunitalea chrysea TaxID=1647581 RepID=UPI00248FB904|nr:cysteine-rich CWC family protein [Neptunitalea chrysea]